MPFAGIFPFLCFRIRERLPGHPGTLFPCSAPDDAFSGKKLQSVLSPFQILNFIQLFLFFLRGYLRAPGLRLLMRARWAIVWRIR
ncbi:MAG TPA: hypothetical protein DCM58_05470 [Desulfovibrio sp.]|nr:hypothetical protein [Desulfovibrio sp.]